MYTIGQLAEIAGVSPKALRIYEKKGLLKPERDAGNHYRKYGEAAVFTLQKIRMFRFLGFSLGEIQVMIEETKESSLEESFIEQKRLLEQKKRQMETAISCIDKAICECRVGQLNMDELFWKMKMIQKNRQADEMVWELIKYSSEAEDWNCFVFSQADLCSGQRILDAGAGWGGLWRKNWERIPENVAITCVDRRNTWADTFALDIREMERTGQQPKGRFSFVWGDMEKIDFGGPYDRIFLNHTAFYLKDGDRMVQRFSDCLADDGSFICTWGGSRLYDQLVSWFREYGSDISELEKRERKYVGWRREWEERIHRIFPVVKKKTYGIELRFERPEDYISFMMQYNKEFQSVLENEKESFARFLQRMADDTGVICVEKDTLLYCCEKGGETWHRE